MEHDEGSRGRSRAHRDTGEEQGGPAQHNIKREQGQSGQARKGDPSAHVAIACRRANRGPVTYWAWTDFQFWRSLRTPHNTRIDHHGAASPNPSPICGTLWAPPGSRVSPRDKSGAPWLAWGSVDAVWGFSVAVGITEGCHAAGFALESPRAPQCSRKTGSDTRWTWACFRPGGKELAGRACGSGEGCGVRVACVVSTWVFFCTGSLPARRSQFLSALLFRCLGKASFRPCHEDPRPHRLPR